MKSKKDATDTVAQVVTIDERTILENLKDRELPSGSQPADLADRIDKIADSTLAQIALNENGPVPLSLITEL